MEQFLVLVRGAAPLLYGIAALSALWSVWSFFEARSELAFAQFRLEREQAEQLGGRALTRAVLSIQFILLVYVLANVTYTAFNDLENPTVADTTAAILKFGTTAPGDNGGQLVIPTQPLDGVIIRSTQPPSPTFAGTLLPADDRLGCIADQANITIPNNGQVIYQTTSVEGVATIENFAYYRFEIRNVTAGDQFFGVIGGAQSDLTVPVPPNGPLGSIIPQNFTPGEYRFRLTIFDTSETMQAACEITIFISEPPPTPTQIGAGISTTGK